MAGRRARTAHPPPNSKTQPAGDARTGRRVGLGPCPSPHGRLGGERKRPANLHGGARARLSLPLYSPLRQKLTRHRGRRLVQNEGQALDGDGGDGAVFGHGSVHVFCADRARGENRESEPTAAAVGSSALAPFSVPVSRATLSPLAMPSTQAAAAAAATAAAVALARLAGRAASGRLAGSSGMKCVRPRRLLRRRGRCSPPTARSSLFTAAAAAAPPGRADLSGRGAAGAACTSTTLGDQRRGFRIRDVRRGGDGGDGGERAGGGGVGGGVRNTQHSKTPPSHHTPLPLSPPPPPPPPRRAHTALRQRQDSRPAGRHLGGHRARPL